MLNRMDDLTYAEQLDRRATVLSYTLIAIKGVVGERQDAVHSE